MDLLVEDCGELSDEDFQNCIICLDSLTTSTSVNLLSHVSTVVDENNALASYQKEISSNICDSVAVGSPSSDNRSVRTALSAILQPLARAIPAGNALCRQCCLLVVQVDRLRAQAHFLESILLARLDGGEGLIPESGKEHRKADGTVRETRGRPPSQAINTETKCQNLTKPAPPSPLVVLRSTASSSTSASTTTTAAATAVVTTASAALINVEIRQEDVERGVDAMEGSFFDSDELGRDEDMATDEDYTPPYPIPVPARAPAPTPIDPPPTYIRQEMNAQCGICDLMFATRVACKDHMRVHQAKKVYFCPLCPAAMMARNALENHEFEQHANSKLRPYGCGQCGEKFPTPRFLRRHKEEEHILQLPCPHCKRAFKGQEELDKHQMVHNDERPYTCPKCGRSFTKQAVWRQHMRTHGRRPRPFQCDKCPRTFLSEIHLAIHSRRHNKPTARCEHCDRSFTSEAWLKRHSVSRSCIKSPGLVGMRGGAGSDSDADGGEWDELEEVYGPVFLPCAGLLQTVSKGSALCTKIIELTRVKDEEEEKDEVGDEGL